MVFIKKPGRIKEILSRSSHATCGPMEREVSVKSSRVASTKATLKKGGFFIVGTSEPNGARRKIWFNPRVSL